MEELTFRTDTGKCSENKNYLTSGRLYTHIYKIKYYGKQ
ncbi:hypothetical protein CLV32_1067 [Pedobacter duraquae]|uniref:Uncharacterized protein n=1 Tax=Pedobacter duraquae TaxID=425511 RepID=A0A4R6IQV6_9SPHI|nr:hypothetical protein CLV32_1067 [Pedobacter duraquae]